MRTAATTGTTTLTRLAEDLRVAAWLLSDDDELRGYLEMLASLPPEPEAWHEVLAPWLDDLRRGAAPDLTDPARVAAAGAVGVAAMRSERELGVSEPLGADLRCVARWAFWLVSPSAY